VWWLRGQRNNLFNGTDREEFRLYADGSVLMPGDMQARALDSEVGSAPVAAIGVGSQIAHVSTDRRQLRVMGYVRDTDGWESQDVAFVSEHLTAPGIREIHHLRYPRATLVAILADGTVAACAFSRAEGVLAWWRFKTSGTVRSACILGGTLYLAVQRGANVYLERHGSEWRLDCAIVNPPFIKDPETGEQVVSGLDALEGLQVAAVGRRNIGFDVATVPFPPQPVVGGAIRLPEDITALMLTTLVVGVPYSATLRTLRPPESTGKKTRHARIGLRLNDSALPIVNGRRVAPDRNPAHAMDAASPRTTGDVEMRDLGWDSDGVVNIEQDLPLRTEILALFGVATANRT
jgi:hypothetical protein